MTVEVVTDILKWFPFLLCDKCSVTPVLLLFSIFSLFLSLTVVTWLPCSSLKRPQVIKITSEPVLVWSPLSGMLFPTSHVLSHFTHISAHREALRENFPRHRARRAPPRVTRCCISVTRSVVSDSSGPHGPQPARLLCPWDSPGQNAGVGCHSLLQG